MKDASDLLQAGRFKDICTAVYEARSWRPGGIVAGADLWDAMMSSSEQGSPYPFTFLNGIEDGIGGRYPGRLITWVSGSGMGKSTAVRELGYADLMSGTPIADVRLEENVGKTGLGYVGLHLNRRLMLGGFDKADPTIREAFEATVGGSLFWTYDHFGSMDDGDLLSKLRYLFVSCGAKTGILDHLSIVVSGMDAEGDERRTIDRLMTALRALVENTGSLLHVVCHLKRAAGGNTSHEEGGRITLADLRGSQSIAQLSDAVIAMERNQQDDEEIDVVVVSTGETRRVRSKDVALWRSLKCRDTGFTGVLGHTLYDTRTGRMVEVKPQAEADTGFKDESPNARSKQDF